MNCNCCNCSNNNVMSCEDEKHSKIKIYGTLVNATLDTTLDDANCAADNQDYDTGHNDALAYAYQIHDGRFRADDEDLPAHERFQDAINRRVTNIEFDPDTDTTTIEGDTHIRNLYIWKDGDWVKIEDAGSYDDAWLKEVIGATPDNHDSREDELNAVNLYPNGGDTPVHKNNIIDFILNLAAEVNDLRSRIIALEEGTDTCLWKTSGDGICPKNANAKVYSDQGFYDRSVNEPQS